MTYIIFVKNSNLNNSLTANNTQFIFDYQDGKYGFNTDPNRGADTFFPFSSGAKIEQIYSSNSESARTFDIKSKIPDHYDKATILICTTSSTRKGGSGNGQSLSWNYNKTTGILSVNQSTFAEYGNNGVFGAWCHYFNYNVYVIY